MQPTLRGCVLVRSEQTVLPCKEISIHWKLFSPGLNEGSLFFGSLLKKLIQGSGNYSCWVSWCLLSAPVIATRGDWGDVAFFFFFLARWCIFPEGLRELCSWRNLWQTDSRNNWHLSWCQLGSLRPGLYFIEQYCYAKMPSHRIFVKQWKKKPVCFVGTLPVCASRLGRVHPMGSPSVHLSLCTCLSELTCTQSKPSNSEASASACDLGFQL